LPAATFPFAIGFSELNNFPFFTIAMLNYLLH
jgi:hypothetical protein